MMVKQTVEVIAGTIIDDDHIVTMVEICRSCDVRADAVTEMIELGILEPVAGDGDRRRFSGTSVRRVLTVVRLQRDLGVNLAGAALALDLLEDIRGLRRRVRALEGRY